LHFGVGGVGGIFAFWIGDEIYDSPILLIMILEVVWVDGENQVLHSVVGRGRRSGLNAGRKSQSETLTNQ